MPRRPRTELAGAVHHVTARTPSGRILFYDDRDWERYLRLLAHEVRERKWRVLTFCLMTNHVHLLVRTPDPDLGAGFKRIHENFARTLNDRHEQQGHVFGSRFYSGLVQSDRHLMGCLRYIARNPVRHGACRQPRDWPWSAHRALAGLTDPPELLDLAEAYKFLGANAEEARFNYLRLVAPTDDALLSELAAAGSDRWLMTAIDSYLFSVPQIADFLAIGRSTAYKRLAAARETVGTDPSVSAQ